MDPKKKVTPNPTHKLAGGVTQTQIDQWKKDIGGSIHPITVAMDDLGNRKVTGYFKKPNLTILSATSSVSSDPMKAGTMMLEYCWLGGDPEIKENDEVKASVIVALTKLFKIREAEVGEL